MFKTRLLSGAVLVAILLFLLITGKDVLLVALMVISLIGMYELYKIFHIEKNMIGIFGYAAAICYYVNIRFALLPDIRLLFLVYLILLLFVFVFSFPKYHASQIMAAFFSLFYVTVMLSCIYETRMLDMGKYLVWLIFICSWGCDTCAYCVGMLFGKHKMAPVLSPKKSVEGAVGGIAGAAVLAILFGMIFKGRMDITVPQVFWLAVICAVGALISMAGDLAASAIKRNYDIKDYGKLIPGHGGILDRFDSVIITAPIVYYLSCYLL